VTLRLAGGQVGSDVFTVEGAPAFALGGRHLLFVEGNDRYLVPLVGMFQGKLDFVESPTSHEPILVDYAGNAVDGIGAKNWHRGGMKLNRDGSLRQPEGAGAAVVSEQGVKIKIEQPKLVDHATPAGQILGQLRAYINGVQDSVSGFDGATYSFSNCPLLIGVDSDSGCTGSLNGYFKGTIDEVRIFNRALSATEIQQEMTRP